MTQKIKRQIIRVDHGTRRARGVFGSVVWNCFTRVVLYGKIDKTILFVWQ